MSEASNAPIAASSPTDDPNDDYLSTLTPATLTVPPISLADDTPVDGYKPKFGDMTRTVLYVTCYLLGLFGALVAGASYLSGTPAWLTLLGIGLSFIAHSTANAFGIAYNPVKMGEKQAS